VEAADIEITLIRSVVPKPIQKYPAIGGPVSRQLCQTEKVISRDRFAVPHPSFFHQAIAATKDIFLTPSSRVDLDGPAGQRRGLSDGKR
jgi:hypothetical protein